MCVRFFFQCSLKPETELKWGEQRWAGAREKLMAPFLLLWAEAEPLVRERATFCRAERGAAERKATERGVGLGWLGRRINTDHSHAGAVGWA